MSVVGYPTPGKDKAHLLLSAFCGGAGGSVAASVPARLAPGAAAFYGVTTATVHLWRQARQEGRDWYYIDNAYFDACRERYFRVTRNSLQRTGREPSDGARLGALGLEARPWRQDGRHVVVCPQSDEFMRLCAEYPGNWLDDTLRWLSAATEREVRVRPWNRNKKQWYASLPADLEGCHALVTYSSASATTAIMHGVPAVCTSTDCVTRPAASTLVTEVDSPAMDDAARARVMRAAADGQFTVREMREGMAWRMAQ